MRRHSRSVTTRTTLDFASHGAEHLNGVLAANNLVNLVERYAKGEIEIWLPLNRAFGEGRVKYLIFFAIPSIMNEKAASPDCKIAAHSYANPANRDWVNRFVLRGITKLIHCPERVIPSFVRFERREKVADFRWNVLASTGQIIEHIIFGGAERKLGRLRVNSNMFATYCKRELVKSGTEIIGTIKNNMRNFFGKLFCKFYLYRICNSSVIFLNDSGPWFIMRKSVNAGLQCGEVPLCVAKHSSWASKNI